MKNSYIYILILLVFFSCKNQTQEDFSDYISEENRETYLSSKTTEISEGAALFIAKKFFNNQNSTKSAKIIDNVETVKDVNGKDALYIINYKGDNGYIIISTSKYFHPIVAYSEDGNFDISQKDETYWYIFKEYLEQISSNRINSNKDSIRLRYASAWSQFEEQKPSCIFKNGTLDYNKSDEIAYWRSKGYECHNLDAIRYFLPSNEAELFIRDISSHTAEGVDCMQASILLIKRSNNQIGKLTKTEWGQGYLPFNVDAPNYLAGCGPIAVSQIMSYHKWPQKYNWEAIGSNPSAFNNEAQRMILDVRDALNVNYEENGTSTDFYRVKNGLRTKFNYTTRTLNYSRLAAVSEIKKGKPILMRGADAESGGHEWVCDGYQQKSTTYSAAYVSAEFGNPEYEFYTGVTKDETGTIFYYNWGWGGDHNGWFYSEDVSPDGTSPNFNNGRQMMFITPNR